MIGPHWSKGWIIEDCEITNSKCCGISLGKYYDPEEWDDESYRRPKPWNVMPGRFWFALDNVRQFKGLAPADYTYVTEAEKKPLSEVNYRNGRIPVARIIPKEGAD